MDFKTLLPDFNALGKTDWSKPQVDTKDTKGLVAIAAAALMLIFVFLPWCKATWMGQVGDSYLGITTWYGILGLVVALAAVVGALYNQYPLTFTAAVLGVLFGVLGMIIVPDATSEEVEFAKQLGIEISHIGAILYLIASVLAAGAAYLKISSK